MTRLLVLVENPSRLSREEAGAWLRLEFAELAAPAEVQRLDVSPLEALCPAWPAGADWLIEVQVSSREAARLMVEGPEASALLRDFQRLGMHPSVQVIDR